MENIEYFAGIRGMRRSDSRARASDLLEQFGLADRANTPVAKLSRGMQQKIAIILALIHRPQLLLLDEPTLGLDLESSNDMKMVVQRLASEGIGILLTTHQLALAEALAHNLLIIRNGRNVLHCPLEDALRDKNRRTYTITLSSKPNFIQQRRLAEAGAEIKELFVTLHGDSRSLYSVMEGLKPLEICEIKTSARSLDDVFMEIACDAPANVSVR